MQEQRGYVETRTGLVHYREQGTGPAVVLLHQTSWNSAQYRNIMPLLAAAGQREERLAVLEKLATLEKSPSLRRTVLGEAARLANELGDADRALARARRRRRRATRAAAPPGKPDRAAERAG